MWDDKRVYQVFVTARRLQNTEHFVHPITGNDSEIKALCVVTYIMLHVVTFVVYML